MTVAEKEGNRLGAHRGGGYVRYEIRIAPGRGGLLPIGVVNERRGDARRRSPVLRPTTTNLLHL